MGLTLLDDLLRRALRGGRKALQSGLAVIRLRLIARQSVAVVIEHSAVLRDALVKIEYALIELGDGLIRGQLHSRQAEEAFHQIVNGVGEVFGACGGVVCAVGVVVGAFGGRVSAVLRFGDFRVGFADLFLGFADLIGELIVTVSDTVCLHDGHVVFGVFHLFVEQFLRFLGSVDGLCERAVFDAGFVECFSKRA